MDKTKHALLFALTSLAFHAGDGAAQSTSDSGRHVFSKAESTATHSFRTSQTKFLLTAVQSGGRFSIVDEIFAPGMDSSPGHRHSFHSEVFYVTSGSMQVTVDGDTQILGPGDLVYIPPNSLHAVKVLGDENAHTLMIFEPGGYEQGYFARSEMTDEQRRDPEAMRRLMQTMDVVPASPAEPAPETNPNRRSLDSVL
jgi:quercetin dioxygenase-like cupin family protein